MTKYGLTRLISIFIFMANLGADGERKTEYQYPFQDPTLAVEERITNILSLMTLDEKIAALSTNPSVPRLGIQGSGHVEGLHGLALGGPGAWGRFQDAEGNQRNVPIPTTQLPQEVGLGETWDPELLQK